MHVNDNIIGLVREGRQVPPPDSTNRICSLPTQEEEEKSMTSNSAETLLDQVKTLTIGASKFALRAEHLEVMLPPGQLGPRSTLRTSRKTPDS